MSKVIVTKSKLDAINTAIDTKTGTATNRTLDDMATAIAAIQTSGSSLPSLTTAATASDIRYGKEAINGQGSKITGTIQDYAGETTTGTPGHYDLYRGLLLDTTTDFTDNTITSLPANACRYKTSITKIDLPSVTSIGASAFANCTGITGEVNIPNATTGANCFQESGAKTLVIKVGTAGDGLTRATTAEHVWVRPTVKTVGGNTSYIYGAAYMKTIEFEEITSLSSKEIAAASFKRSIILRSPSGATSGVSLNRAFISTNELIYVPTSLMSWYSYNWGQLNYTSNDLNNMLVGIDEDETRAVGATFTPSPTGVTIDHWDKVDLQTYSVDANNTFSTSTGSITPSNAGRLLIRALDENDNILYVAYLKIGDGFDATANAAVTAS